MAKTGRRTNVGTSKMNYKLSLDRRWAGLNKASKTPYLELTLCVDGDFVDWLPIFKEDILWLLNPAELPPNQGDTDLASKVE